MSAYGTVQTVKALSGVTADGLGYDTDTALNAFIQSRLDVASDYINRDRNRNFENEVGGVPLMIHDIAERMAANYIRAMMDQRNKSITEQGGEDRPETQFEPTYFTAAIKKDLRRFPRGFKLHMLVTHGGQTDELSGAEDEGAED